MKIHLYETVKKAIFHLGNQLKILIGNKSYDLNKTDYDAVTDIIKRCVETDSDYQSNSVDIPDYDNIIKE